MTQPFSRTDVILQGVKGGYSFPQINNTLNRLGMEPVKGPLENLSRDAKEVYRGLKTIGGYLSRPFTEPLDAAYTAPMGSKTKAMGEAFKRVVASDPNYKNMAIGAAAGGAIGTPFRMTVPGAILGGTVGLMGGVKNFANANLAPYNTSVEEIQQGKFRPGAALLGAYEHPLTTVMDFGHPIIKGAGRAAKDVANTIPANAPLALQQIFPSKTLRQLNRFITEDLNTSSAKRSKTMSGYNALTSAPFVNREKIVRNITMNKGGLTKEEAALAKLIKQDLRGAEANYLTRNNVDPTAFRQNAIAQYVTASLENKMPELLHEDVINYLNGIDFRPEVSAIIKKNKLGGKISDLISEGDKLYQDGKIAFLSQKLVPSRDPLGIVRARDLNRGNKGYFDVRRIVGTTPAADQAKKLDQTIKFQLDQLGEAQQAIDLINNTLEQVKATKLKAGDIIPEGKMAIDKEAFNREVIDAINRGEEVDIPKALGNATNFKEGAYIVDKVYGEAIKNALGKSKLGAIRNVSSAFKRAVLANPHWIAANRVGNISNNLIGGVTFNDYKDAWKLKDLIPERLKQQTAYNSFVGATPDELAKMTRWSALTQPINQGARAWENFKASDKSIGDVLKLVGDEFAATSNLTANPLFRMESELERIDRYANFIKQAKEYAKGTNKSYLDIIKKANEDDKLFNRLNERVNKDLGDYLGKNYAVPTGVYDTLSELVPFYRFITQTGRTTAHQLSRHPLEFYSVMNAPAKIGTIYSDAIYNTQLAPLNIDKESYTGGIPYAMGNRGDVRLRGVEPLPFGAVARQLTDINEFAPSISPIYGSLLSDVLRYKQRGQWTPSSPGLTQAMIEQGISRNDYEPTALERLQYGVNQMLGVSYNPYKLMFQYGPELGATVSGNRLQSRYATNPFLEDPLSYPRVTPTELIGRWGTVTSEGVYPTGKKGKRQMKTDKLRAARTRKAIEANREVMRQGNLRGIPNKVKIKKEGK